MSAAIPKRGLPLTHRVGPGEPDRVARWLGAHAYRADGELPWSLFWVHFQDFSLIPDSDLGEAAESGS